MLKRLFLALALLFPVVAHAQWAGIGYTPAPGVPASGGTFTGPVVINGALSGSAFGVGVGLVPQFGNYQSSGFPYLAVPTRMIIQQSTVTNNDFATLQLERTTAFTSAAGNINSNLRATTTVGTNDGTNTWSILGLCNTVSTAGGTCAGVTGHGTRNVGGTQAVWGGVFDAKDNTDLASLASGQGVVGAEVDVGANLLDTAVNSGGLTGQGNRVGLQISAYRPTLGDTTLSEVAYGIFYTVGTTAIYYDSLIGAATNVMAQYALDTRALIVPTGSSNPVNAVAMAAGQIIEFNGPASYTAAPVRSLRYSTGSSALLYNVAATTQFSVGDTGTLTIGSGGGSISNSAGQLNLLAANGFGLEIATVAGGANGILIITTATGVDPTIKPYGDANRNLNLAGAGTGSVLLPLGIKFASSTTGAGAQTFTNSPCGTLTTERWIPVTIAGQSGTWNIPACQ